MNKPRGHHFVPKFYLKGFTKESSVHGKLWVVDLVNRKRWQSTPVNAAVERDFYAFDLGRDVDPMWFESAFGEDLEPVLAQVLDFVLDTKEIPPCGLAHQMFLNLLATSLVRGPTMREVNSACLDAWIKKRFRELAESEGERIALQQSVEDAGLPLDQFLSLNDEGAFYYDFDRITHLNGMIEQSGVALEIFSCRTWTVRLVDDAVPDLICSDIPIGIVPLTEEVPLVWLDANALVVMPLNRRTVAIGLLKEIELPDLLGVRQVAAINASIMRGATQLYCSGPEFTISNGQGIQTVDLSGATRK